MNKRMADRFAVRPEAPRDRRAVALVHDQAFGRAAEGDLAAALSAAGAGMLSLVAAQDDWIVGHILFSPVTIVPPAGLRAAATLAPVALAPVALAPMAVLPWLQRRGIGSRLVQAGVAALRPNGHGAVFVLGAPALYGRFGFVPASDFGLCREGHAPEPAFLALELTAGVLAGVSGTIRYRAEFSRQLPPG